MDYDHHEDVYVSREFSRTFSFQMTPRTSSNIQNNQSCHKKQSRRSTPRTWSRCPILSSSTGFSLPFIILTILLSRPPSSQALKSDNCEYQMDLTKNFIKIVCEGSPTVVNIYANQAMLRDPETGASEPVMAMYRKSTTVTPHSDLHSRPGESFNEASAQKDFQDMAHKWKSSGSFAEVVRNATQNLEKTRSHLTTCMDSLHNITSYLANGSMHLTSDSDMIRRNSNTATDLKERIIAAMTNQHKYMNNALLSQNQALKKIISSLTTLIDITSNGLQGALSAHKMAMDQISHINKTLLIVHKKMKRLLNPPPKGGVKEENRRIKNLLKAQCPRQISAIGTGTSKKVNWTVGAYMVDSLNPNEYRSVFIMAGIGPTDQLLEYDATADVDHGLVGRYFALPFFCSGTGHVVYRRHFYCHKADTNRIVKYHLKRMDIIADLVLPGAGYGNKYPYRSEQNTDIDLAVDELGLWAIYATDDSAGKMVITKIEHQKMEIVKTWMTSYPKEHIGNAFMICGILYATSSHKDTPTFIRYTYNTDTNKGQVLERGELPFANSAVLSERPQEEKTANSVMLSYDLRTSTLYSWNNGRIESFPVYFKETL